MFDSIEDIVSASLAKTVWRDVSQAWDNYERLCKRSRVLPLWGQFETAVKRMKREGKIIVQNGKAKLA